MTFLSTLVFHAINGGFWRYLGDTARVALTLLAERIVSTLTAGVERCGYASQSSYAAYVLVIPFVLVPLYILVCAKRALVTLWEAIVELWETLADLPVTRKGWEAKVKRNPR